MRFVIASVHDHVAMRRKRVRAEFPGSGSLRANDPVLPPVLIDAAARSDLQTPTMSDQVTPELDHAHMLTVFSVSAGMVGVCLTAIGLIQVMEHLKQLSTLCDEILVVDALLFLASSIFSYWALHHRMRKHYRRMRFFVDSLMMGGIVMMAVICALIAWTIV